MADKVAFLALTYSSFQKEDLMKKFFNEEDKDKYNLYIHNKVEISDNYFAQFCLPDDFKVETEWAKYSLILATIRLINYAIRDPDNKKFILISDSHCPIFNMATTCQKLFKDFEVMSFYQPKKSNKPKEQILGYVFSRVRKYCPFKASHALYVSQWFVFNRSDAECFILNEPKLRKWFNLDGLSLADEIYFPLIANYFNLPFKNKKSTHFNREWKTHKSLISNKVRDKPHTYLKINSKFIDSLREQGCLFFRKVHKETKIDENYIFNYFES
jgi:hypothetical protein